MIWRYQNNGNETGLRSTGKVENGADLIAAIKGEINTLNNEAKKHRTAGEQSATKLKSILEAVSVRRRIKITRPNERE